MESGSTVLAAYRVSWTAYVRPLLLAVVFAVAGFLIAVGFKRWWSEEVGIAYQWIAGGAGLVAIVWLVYQVIYLRSVKIYTDEAGVWLYQGVFPWQTGIYGVKWRDVDGAVFRKGFISWVCRSYFVQVGHRYTKANELFLPHVNKGHRFVEHVNQEHQERLQHLRDSGEQSPQ